MQPDSTVTRWIDLLISRSGELRNAGVLSIEIDGCAATFAPLPALVVPVGDIDPPDESASGSDPLHDPASYPGGVVPGFAIQKFEPEDF